ncbi:MAG TPA: metalloregulator ArsR/SmtB family transcription factor [Allosphingosinicella sp.]|nr:metalloregulator ArsR/SmtB family transcription factor [Allosphingosinicella sp.]
MPRPAADASPFSAIAHPTRRAVLDLLMVGERSANELRLGLTPGISGTSQAAFSEHLSILSRAGLVEARPQGRERIYSLNARPLAEAFDWLKPFEAFWDEKLANLGDYLDRKARPQ